MSRWREGGAGGGGGGEVAEVTAEGEFNLLLFSSLLVGLILILLLMTDMTVANDVEIKL